MSLRIASIDNGQFEICVKKGVWGSNNSGLTKWQVGDKLLFFVEKEVAGLAEISGQYFASDEIVWGNGVFPYRVPLKFLFVLPKEKRLPTRSVIKDKLMSVWGYNWGWGIQVKQPVPQKEAEEILNYITEEMSKPVKKK